MHLEHTLVRRRRAYTRNTYLYQFEPYGNKTFFNLWVWASVEYAVCARRFFRAGDLCTFKWLCPAFPCEDETRSA